MANGKQKTISPYHQLEGLNNEGHLIHIVPDINGICTVSPRPFSGNFLSSKQFDPPIPTGGIEEINPGAAARPTPTLILPFATLGFYNYTKFGCLLVYRIVRYSFQMGVDDNDHL